jgi:hypothetical protein
MSGSQLSMYPHRTLMNDNHDMMVRRTNKVWALPKKFYQDRSNTFYSFAAINLRNGIE